MEGSSSINENASSLHSTFKFNNHSVRLLQRMTCFEIIGFHLILCKTYFQEHHRQLMHVGTGFISSASRRWYWALLTAFLSNWRIFSLNKPLQFLVIDSSEERISYRLKKSSKQLAGPDSLEQISSTLISSSIKSCFERFCSWLLVQTIMYGYR